MRCVRLQSLSRTPRERIYSRATGSTAAELTQGARLYTATRDGFA